MTDRTHREKYRLKYTQTITNFLPAFYVYAPSVFTSLTQSRNRSIGTKFFPHEEKIEKHSHNFDSCIRQRILVTKYSHNSSHNSPAFLSSLRRAIVYISVRPKERPKNKTLYKNNNIKNKKKSDIKRRKNNDRYDEHGNQ